MGKKFSQQEKCIFVQGKHSIKIVVGGRKYKNRSRTIELCDGKLQRDKLMDNERYINDKPVMQEKYSVQGYLKIGECLDTLFAQKFS